MRLFRLETASAESERHRKALLSVIGSVETLTTCGFNELSPDAISHQSFHTNFLVPVPIGKGRFELHVKKKQTNLVLIKF